jgi:hypothetical protein
MSRNDDPDPIKQRREGRRQEEQERRRGRRRKTLLWGGLCIVLLTGLAITLALTKGSSDKEAADGFAAGRVLTAEPTADTSAEIKRQNAKLKRRIAREKKTENQAPQPDGDSTGSTPKSFNKLAASINGPIGVSYGPVGSSSQTTAGDWDSGVAWSTAKVPVAVALSRSNGGGTTSSMRSAITASDNSGAEAMWSALGSGSRAGTKVDRVLADAGDSTQIETERVRSGFTPFGQTVWPLGAQQQFAAHLPCISGSDAVLSLMGQVVSGQRWGLGTIGSSPRFKGGWGPGSGGGYLVRQFGIVEVDGGKLAVAIAAEPSDGSFETGKADLDKIAAWIESNLRGRPARC